MTFELTRIWIRISVQVIRYLEIGLNLENCVLSYSTWKLFITLDGAYLPHLMTLIIWKSKEWYRHRKQSVSSDMASFGAYLVTV